MMMMAGVGWFRSIVMCTSREANNRETFVAKSIHRGSASDNHSQATGISILPYAKVVSVSSMHGG